MKLRTALPPALALAVLATGSFAEPFSNSSQAVGQPEALNGIAIRAEIERLSYISPRYLGIRPSGFSKLHGRDLVGLNGLIAVGLPAR